MAVFYQVAGTQVVLPDYARADLAFTWTYYVDAPAQHGDAVVTVTGSYIEVPIAASFRLATGGVAGNRLAYVGITDSNGNTISVISAAATQPASTSQYYAANAGTPYPYAPTTNASVFGVPVIACLPEWQITLSAYGQVGADTLSQITLTVVRVPTGPSLSSTSLPLTVPALA